MLPSYIPVRVAEKILFVGESVQMFENQNVNLTRKGKEHLSCSLCSVVSDKWIPQHSQLFADTQNVWMVVPGQGNSPGVLPPIDSKQAEWVNNHTFQT